MRAPVSRVVPWTVAPRPSVRVESSSALVRSSAVRPGARKEHSGPMETLLSSLMDRSIPPVTWQVPSRVSSAPTESRGALTAVPPVLAREYALPTGTPPVASSVALRTRNWPPIRARPMSTRPRISGRRPELVINQEDAALDHCLAKIQGQAGQRRFKLRAREVQRAVDPRADQAQLPRAP